MSRKLLAITLLADACILGLVFGGKDTRVLYTRSVSAFAARPVRERVIRIDGVLVPGSLCQLVSPCGYHFRVSDHSFRELNAMAPRATYRELAVDYRHCLVPDSFRQPLNEEVRVTFEGKQCATCSAFEASVIYTKADIPYAIVPHSENGHAPRPILLDVPLCAAK